MIGLIAGGGDLPLIFAKTAKAKGVKVVTAAIKGEAKINLKNFSDKLFFYGMGDLGKALKMFKVHGVKKICIVGKVKKIKFLSLLRPDMKIFKIIMNLVNKKDTTLIYSIIREIEREGIKVLPMTVYLKPLLAKKGILSKRHPTRKELAEIKFAFPVAKKIADLDIGQTVIVKDKAVIAAEGIEGTDSTIKRGGELAGKGAVCVKVARTKQDFRVDIPGIGVDTIKNLIKAGISCIAIESGKMLIVDEKNVKKEADKGGICVVAV